MATTSRKASRTGKRRTASPPAGRKREAPSERDGRPTKRSDGETANAVAKAQKSAADKTRNGDKVVRDTFKMPEREYALIDVLKQRCRAFGVEIKKSEVLRAGLIAMRELSDARLGDVVRPLAAARTEREARKRAKPATAA